MLSASPLAAASNACAVLACTQSAWLRLCLSRCAPCGWLLKAGGAGSVVFDTSTTPATLSPVQPESLSPPRRHARKPCDRTSIHAYEDRVRRACCVCYLLTLRATRLVTTRRCILALLTRMQCLSPLVALRPSRQCATTTTPPTPRAQQLSDLGSPTKSIAAPGQGTGCGTSRSRRPGRRSRRVAHVR